MPKLGKTPGVFHRAPRAFTFVEIMLAFLILASLFLAIFNYLTGAVRETERSYIEAVAISHAKFVMDTLMFQIPWRCIRAGNPSRFADPKNIDSINGLLQIAIPKMFGTGCRDTQANTFKGDGIILNSKGFYLRVRLKCIDVDSVEFRVGPKTYSCNDVTANDADGKPSLIKKMILQIQWSLKKTMDPKDDPLAQNLFLVGLKSDLER